MYMCYRPRRRYGFANMFLDIFLPLITAGLWIFVIAFRELRDA